VTINFNQEWAEPLTLQENLVVGIGLQLSDNLSLPWQDGVSFFKSAAGAGTVVQAQFSEDLLMAPQGDFARLGFGLVFAESMTLIDTFFYVHAQRTAGGNTGSRVSIGDNGSPKFSEATQLVLGLNLPLVDNLNYWLDPQLNLQSGDFSLAIVCPEFGPLWADAVKDVLGLNETLSDTMTFSDVLAIGYGDQITDTLVLLDIFDALAQGGSFSYELFFGPVVVATDTAGSESLSLADSFNSFLVGVLTESLADTLTLSDALAIGYGEGIVEQLTFSDSSRIEYGLQIADQLVLSDQNPTVTGVYDLVIACPHLNNWVDTILSQLSIAEAFSDSLTMSDALGLGYGEGIVEQLTLFDVT